MMKTILRISLLIAGGVLLNSRLASADAGVLALGGITMDYPNVTVPAAESGTSITSGFSPSYGLGFLYEISSSRFYWEVGLYSLTRKSTLSVPGQPGLVQTTKYWQIPVMARYFLTPSFSFGAGLYYALGTGNVSSSQGGVAQPDQSFSAAGFLSSDYGIIGSLRAQMALAPSLHGVLDLRLLDGLKNVSAVSNQTWKYFDFQTLVGLEILF